MTTYELNAEAFERIIKDFGFDPDPSYNEADTRVKVIDRILCESLGWPEMGPYIKREEYVHKGYIDYILQVRGIHLIIEAKRIGKSFKIPKTFSYQKQLSVKNLLNKQSDLQLIYDQVTKYAHQCGIIFCGITNGTQWLIFPGVRTDNIHIRHSRVIVFNGLESIKKNFLDFWSLLSFESVGEGSLRRELIEPMSPIEKSFSFATEERVFMPFDRNNLSPVMNSILSKYFGDLYGDPSKTKMLLKECYVYDEPIGETIKDLNLIAGDEMPSKSINTKGPVLHFYSLPKVADKIKNIIDSFLQDEANLVLQILVGRVGIGKTTFLHYFLDSHARDLKEDNFTLLLDMRDTSEHMDINQFFIDALWEMFREHPQYDYLMSHSTLQEIYADDIKTMSDGALSPIQKRDPDAFTDEISKFLQRKIEDRAHFLKKLVSYINTQTSTRFILIFDNVDQIPHFELQQKIIRFAYSKGREFKAFLIISMWEETYYSSKRSGQTLSTIRTVPLQITRQSISSVLTKRIKFLTNQVQSGAEPLHLLDKSCCDHATFCQFLELTSRSLLVDNKRVRMFLESIALGNIRRALEIFHKFLTAGSLNTPKFLTLMNKYENYVIPEFEFVTSVMLGSNRYYSERTSEILNLFAIGDMERPSHFTRLRILQWLYQRKNEATPFGMGYMTINKTFRYFFQIGVSQKDLTASLLRLIENALVEDDLRSQKLTKRAQAIRITPTGRYYLAFICKLFAYVDLVLLDTPLFDESTYFKIAPYIDSTDISSRLKRCDAFITYLEDQESEEIVTLSKLGKEYVWKYKFTERIRASFDHFFNFAQSKMAELGE